jgi:high-affinity nickel permease
VAGLDHALAALAHGGGLAFALLVALLLGLRHATDPDHLTAVTTLVAGGEQCGARRAGTLGAAWGAGHAATLLAVGVPLVLARGALPPSVERGAEAAIGVVIVALALRLLRRRHAPAHAERRGRMPLAALGIGALHGLGGSGGVALLVVAAMPGRTAAALALALFATAAALSMALVSAAFGLAVGSDAVAHRFARLTPLLGTAGIAFGACYALAAI